MSNTKNVLMLVVLSAGILTALTATGMSQAQTAFASLNTENTMTKRECVKTITTTTVTTKSRR